MYLQFGGIAMKQDIGIKNAQAQSEAAMGIYKETLDGLWGMVKDVGDLVGTSADIAFGEAKLEGSVEDLYQRNHILQYAVERGREQQEYIESVRSGERSYGQVAFDALQKSMEIQWAPAIDTIESIKTIVKGSGTINPYASTLEQNQEFGRRSGKASQELLLFASNFIGVGRAAKPAASAAKKLSKAEKALQGSHHEESGGGKGIGALLGGKDAAKAAGVGQGGVKTGATAVLLMARSAISRAGSKGSSLLAGLMSKKLVKQQPFGLKVKSIHRKIITNSQYINPKNYNVGVINVAGPYGGKIFNIGKDPEKNIPLFHSSEGNKGHKEYLGKENNTDPIKDPKDWLALLNDSEINALLRYQSNDIYRELNRGLRNGDLDTKLEKYVPLLDSAIAKGVTQKDLLLYRGFSSKDIRNNWSKIMKLHSFKFSDKAYVSTTTNPGVAEMFAMAHDEGVFATIKVKKGTSIANIGALDDMENGILFG